MPLYKTFRHPAEEPQPDGPSRPSQGELLRDARNAFAACGPGQQIVLAQGLVARLVADGVRMDTILAEVEQPARRHECGPELCPHGECWRCGHCALCMPEEDVIEARA